MDYNNIYFGAYGSNGLIKVYVLVTFCVLVDSLVILSISALGAKRPSFIISILYLSTTEIISAYLSSNPPPINILAMVLLSETLVLL